MKIENFLSSREAALIVGVAHRTMRKYAHQFPGLSHKLAGRLLIDRDELSNLIKKGSIGLPKNKGGRTNER